MMLPTLTPAEAQRAIKAGALLIDIREHDEHAREAIPGALNLPLARIGELPLAEAGYVFHCRSGMRTDANAARLAAAARGAPCHSLAGGIDAWRAAGQMTLRVPGQPIEIMRQVQLVAGGLVLIGVVLGFLVSPALFGLSAFVGAGLMTAGATGWCGMAKLLRHLPWNRPATSA
ncbi:MAG: rhodanese family protein [Novosphingobium sp.]|nr:rhodanese family protein [Novosphingobium sp.]